MSTLLLLQIWLKNAISESEMQAIDDVIHQIDSSVEYNETSWKGWSPETFYREETRKRILPPIASMTDYAQTDALRLSLRNLVNDMVEHADHRVDRSWNLRFTDSSPLPGAPAAEDSLLESVYPSFTLRWSYDVFGLLTGLGIGLYASKKRRLGERDQLEQIVAELGYLPTIQLMIASTFLMRDDNLAGHLAYWLMERTQGWLEIFFSYGRLEDGFEELHFQAETGTLPGRAFSGTKKPTTSGSGVRNG